MVSPALYSGCGVQAAAYPHLSAWLDSSPSSCHLGSLVQPEELKERSYIDSTQVKEYALCEVYYYSVVLLGSTAVPISLEVSIRNV
jgi:hypothetical protein